jgi:radical SAM superfamily enzyme YgiQ (UPF0313 family)
MDVLLLNPGWMSREGNIWKKISGALPPLGIAYIASYLEKNSINVRIIDIQAEPLSTAELLDSVTFSPGYIGITATTMTVKSALETAALCRKKFPAAKIVFGGVHPTIMPEDVLSSIDVDYAVRGEGERAMLELIQGKDPAVIEGLSYKKDGGFIHNAIGPVIADLDTLPFPAYSLLPVKNYMPTLGSYKRLPAISLITTRGCPGKCTFCMGSYLGGRIRMHSTRYIIDEIKMLIKDYGIREISFYDDTFTAFRHKVRDFCKILIDEKIDITWSCFARVDFVDADILGLMKRAGCHQIMYGIESGSDEILKNIKKKTSLIKAVDIVALTKKTGIECRAAFMLGNPGETQATMEQTLDFAKKLDPDIALFNITTPYPGTEMYDWADKNGYLKTKDWSKYDLSNAVMELPTVSSRAVEAFYKKAHNAFYGRPSYLLKRLLKIRSLNDLLTAIKGGLAVFTG